jgi:hypothetical protein
MRLHLIALTAMLLVATRVPAHGQSLVYCPTAPEERERRCNQVQTQIAREAQQIEAHETLLHDAAIILALVHKMPAESTADYRARVRRQAGVVTPASNTWLPVAGHFYNPVQQRMYVALSREAYWHYLYEGLAFDPDLAAATFKRRARRSQREKAYQLENPDSATNQARYYTLETLRAFQRECCQPAAPEGVLRPEAPIRENDRRTVPATQPGPPDHQAP